MLQINKMRFCIWFCRNLYQGFWWGKVLEMQLSLKSSPIVISSSRENIVLLCTSQTSSWVDSCLNVSSHIAGKARWQIGLSMQFQKSMIKCREIVSIFYENLAFESVTWSLKAPLHLINGYRHPRHSIFMRSEISSTTIKGGNVFWSLQRTKKEERDNSFPNKIL